MALNTVEYLKVHGLEALLEEYSLKCVEYDNKVLIKYDQIESSFAHEITRECRGLILEKGTWRVMSYPLKKFFNAQEGYAPDICWETALIQEKVDGTFIHLYWDWHKDMWVCATTGMAEAEGNVNNRLGFTFHDLFWETIESKYPEFDTANLNKGLVYMFELTSPYNLVVKQHKTPELTLLAIRDLSTLKEWNIGRVTLESFAIGIPMVKLYKFRANFNELMDTFKGMPYSEEGYVVLDVKGNRVKVKNPAYVAVHHLKDKMNSYNIMQIIKTNEVEEFNATFPERTEEVLALKKNFDDLYKLLKDSWTKLVPHTPMDNDDRSQVKDFAKKVFELVDSDDRLKMFSGLFFNLANGKADDILEYINDVQNRRLYYELKSEKWNTKK